MRFASIGLAAVVLGSLAFAGACSERFPQPNVVPVDAGAADAALPPLEGSPPAVLEAGKRADASSSPVVFDAIRGGVWTANGDVGSVSYVDVDTRALVAEIVLPGRAGPSRDGADVRSVALSPDGVWLAAVDRGGAAVVLIDAESRTIARTIPLGTHPRAAVWDAADPRWLYVAVEDTDSVAVIDRTLGVVARTIPVGRLPSGVAVSRARRELYVTHRIDASVTIVPIAGATAASPLAVPLDDASIDGAPGDSAAAAPPPLTAPLDVPLAHEDNADGLATTPHGTPFAFESLAWAPDGKVAWLPHEILASTHPFQFQTTLFPAVSVVDLAARAEVQTDPADPRGVIAGRKNLFAAIKVTDPKGNTTILSQPCAAAFHPNGTVAYVLACGSEDFLTFDVTQGIAIDILRGLPGDHPVGLALDDTGQRAFVLSDQSADPALKSKSLAVIDLASGSLLAHPRVVGAPIGLVASDPIDPDMRAGLRLFYRANSRKGPLAVTGDDWMSCGGCHLDGFVSTNQAFFDDLAPLDPTVDARIGHTGLKDFFSTTPPKNAAVDPDLDPHDVLVAFAEQGGLAPDVTGAKRDGAIDPSKPTPAAAAMAAQVAKVIARDLPLGPTWLLPGDPKPNADYDGKWCGQCHADVYKAWQKSVHAHAGEDPMVRFGARVEVGLNGAQYPRLCAGCHTPVAARGGDTSLASGAGVTCLGCHDTERLIRAGGNADLEARAHDWTQSHVDRAKAGLTKLRDPAFCGGCHQQFVPGSGIEAIATLHEWRSSPYSGAAPGSGGGGADAGGGPVTTCVDCHVKPGLDGIPDHTMIGGNVYMARTFGDDAMVGAEQAKLASALSLSAARVGTAVAVTVTNGGAGHSFPTGVTDVREPWVELQAVDAQHKAVARYGGPAPDGTVPPGSARFGMDIAKPDGTVLFLHELSATTRISFARVVPAGSARTVYVSPPKSLPSGAVGLDAVLLYRNVRTPYFRAATKDVGGDPNAIAPEVEVSRVAVP